MPKKGTNRSVSWATCFYIGQDGELPYAGATDLARGEAPVTGSVAFPSPRAG